MTIKPGPKTALVLGAGRARIGNSVAKGLAAHGFRLALHYHNSASGAETTARELRLLGTDCEIYQANLTQEAEVEVLTDSVYSHFGQIDLLVASQGLYVAGKLEHTAAEEVIKHFQVNILGTFLIAKSVGLRMTAQAEGGSIVTFGDWACNRPYLDYAAYFCSKGAIYSMTCMLAAELGAINPLVRVNCIAPGAMIPPDNLTSAEEKASAHSSIAKRWGGAEDISRAVLFLSDSTFCTGSVITVDGGRSIV